MTSTKRQPRRYASPGAVRNQQGGELREVKTCNKCGTDFVFVTSKRTGNWYRVNVRGGFKGQLYYMGNDLHKCDEVLAERAKWENARTEETRQKAINEEFSMRLRTCQEQNIDWLQDDDCARLIELMTGQNREIAVELIRLALKVRETPDDLT